MHFKVLLFFRKLNDMKKEWTEKQLLLLIRLFVIFFIGALVVSGLTAFPLETELEIVCKVLGVSPDVAPETYSGLQHWMAWIYQGLVQTNMHYPFLSYGTDWLAFAHIVIAIAFIGLYRRPIRNKWIIYWAMIACVAVIPTTLICGPIRQIPFFWQLVDCSFGVFGLIPLYVLHRLVKRLEEKVGYPELIY